MGFRAEKGPGNHPLYGFLSFPRGGSAEKSLSTFLPFPMVAGVQQFPKLCVLSAGTSSSGEVSCGIPKLKEEQMWLTQE